MPASVADHPAFIALTTGEPTCVQVVEELEANVNVAPTQTCFKSAADCGVIETSLLKSLSTPFAFTAVTL